MRVRALRACVARFSLTIAQLSVASAHSPTNNGNVALCTALTLCRHEHAFSKKESCERISNHAW